MPLESSLLSQEEQSILAVCGLKVLKEHKSKTVEKMAIVKNYEGLALLCTTFSLRKKGGKIKKRTCNYIWHVYVSLKM